MKQQQSITAKQAVVQHLKKQTLSDEQLETLLHLQNTSTHKRPPKRWLFGAAAAIVIAIALALINYIKPSDLSSEIASEVAKNHLKLRPLEVEGQQLASLTSYFSELDFRLQNSGLSQLSDLTLMGGRYCSVQGKTAAQLRLKSREGKIQTLYQTSYDPKHFGKLPNTTDGELPKTLHSRGVQIDLWVEKGLLFILSQEANNTL